MQGIPDGYLLLVRQETDTATPRTPVPIYPVHTQGEVFCQNLSCICHRYEAAVMRLLGAVAGGALTLEAAAPLLAAEGEGAVSSAAGTASPARTVITVDLLPGIPEDCQLYGHSWEQGSDQGVKECALCGIRGYCPACTPQAPAGAQPFTCTRHASREVRP